MTDPIFYSEEAELAFLGAVLQDSNGTLSMALRHQAKADWFTSGARQALWSILVDLRFHNIPIDLVSVNERAKQKGCDAEIVSTSQRACDACITTAHSKHYLELIEEKYLLRKTLLIAQQAVEDCKGGILPKDVAAKVRFELDAIDNQTHGELTKEEIYDAIKETVKRQEQEGHIGIPSRWMPLQRKLGGYRRGKMCVLAARPTIGKTTFFLNEARIMAELGYKVGFISLETTEEEVYSTMAAELAEVDLFKPQHEGWTDEEKQKFDDAIKHVLTLPIYLSCKSMDIKHIVNWIHYMRTKRNVDIVGLDYISIITPNEDDAKLVERIRISTWSKSLKRAFHDNNVAGIVICQLNRQSEPPSEMKASERWRHMPKLIHLKESGAIEEDAYQALLLCLEPSKRDMSAEIHVPLIVDVAKHKQGPTGRINMLYKKDMQRMEATGCDWTE